MLNKCEFIGRLTKDVDLRYTQSGSAVGNFTVACGEKWTDKNTGEKKEATEFVRCVAWGKVGELAAQYLNKGSLIYVCGKQQTRKWDKDGVTQYTTEINVNDLKFLDSRSESQGQQQAQRPIPPSQVNGHRNPAPPANDFDDDIPF